MSSYKRKTEDVFYLETDYGYGKELECAYSTKKEAREGMREYIKNSVGLVDIRIVKKREEIEKEETK